MKKAELVSAIFEKGEFKNKKEAENALNAVIEALTDVLVAGDKITLIGFGTFKTKFTPERPGINPRTKESVVYPAKTVPVFKPAQSLKDIVNK